jgi:hypothetical protein
MILLTKVKKGALLPTRMSIFLWLKLMVLQMFLVAKPVLGFGL